MQEAIGFATSLFSGLDLRKRATAGLGILAIFLFSVWIFESFTGHFYYQTLAKRVDILEQLQLISVNGIDPDSELYPIYASTVDQLTKRIDFRVQFPSFAAIDPITLGKAISGSSLWIVVLLVGVTSDFQKEKRITTSTIGLGLLIGLTAYFFGWIGTLIPTLWNPWVNYIGFPSLQILLISLVGRLIQRG